MRIFGPRVEIVAPGTDPLQRPVNNTRPELPWKWIAALVVVLVVTFGPILAVKAAKPSPDLGAAATQTRAARGDFTRTPTPTGYMSSPTPTATETPLLMAALAQLTNQPSYQNDSNNSCNSITTIRVEVTRVVKEPAPACSGGAVTTINTEVTRMVTRQVTQMVTSQVTQMVTQINTQVVTELVTQVVTEIVPGPSSTPGPTSTPWVIIVEITRLVEVTSTPTMTPTATQTPTATPAPTETAIIPYPYP